MKKTRLLCLLIVALLCLFSFPTAAAPTDEEIEKLELVTAENTVPKNIYYYNGTTQYSSRNYRPEREIFTRVEGRAGGSALDLSGNKQYLRLPSAVLNELDSYTFSTWIKWKGNTGKNGADDQKLLTLFVNQYSYLSVSIHRIDEEKGLDGPCLSWATPETDVATVFTATEDGTTFAFPQNEWHHVAVTVSETKLTFYIDGVRYLHADIQMNFDEMPARKLLIGSGFDTEPTPNAALEDAALYTSALSDAQVSVLARDLDPLSDPISTTTTEVLATRPSTTVTLSYHTDTFSGRILGLPISMVITLGVLIIVIAALSVIFSIRGSRAVSTEDEEGSV